eukprot:m.483548 g.483548  ORF g.483548 m.483548 type:complete len:102 (+) comp22976_c0_seq1:780-1085(+)
MVHTILLVQPDPFNAASRTFGDYETVPQAMEGVCKIFETHLKTVFPHKEHIHYQLSQLHQFIDGLGDISCLVLQPASGMYAPRDRTWIKEHVRQLLSQQAM